MRLLFTALACLVSFSVFGQIKDLDKKNRISIKLPSLLITEFNLAYEFKADIHNSVRLSCSYLNRDISKSFWFKKFAENNYSGDISDYSLNQSLEYTNGDLIIHGIGISLSYRRYFGKANSWYSSPCFSYRNFDYTYEPSNIEAGISLDLIRATNIPPSEMSEYYYNSTGKISSFGFDCGKVWIIKRGDNSINLDLSLGVGVYNLFNREHLYAEGISYENGILIESYEFYRSHYDWQILPRFDCALGYDF